MSVIESVSGTLYYHANHLTLFSARFRVFKLRIKLPASPQHTYITNQEKNKRVMLKTTLFRTAIAIGCLMTMSVIASADTKVKSRQTSGGQTYENTSYIKGKRQRSETNNGQMIMIQQCDLRRNIQIMPQAKVYMIQPYDEPATSNAANTSTTARRNPAHVKRAEWLLQPSRPRHRRAQADVWLHSASHHHHDGDGVVP